MNHGQDNLQLRELTEYAKRRGWTIFGEYVDQGISGSKEKRPELDRLMDDAHRRKFDVLWALDTFRALGVEFFSLSESVDTATPVGPHGLHRFGLPWPSWRAV